MHSHQRCKLIDALALFMAWGAVALASARIAAWHLSSQLNLQTRTARAAMAPKRAREPGTTANKPSKSAKAAQPLPDIEDFSPSDLQQVSVCPVPFHSVCYQLRSIQAIVLGGRCRRQVPAGVRAATCACASARGPKQRSSRCRADPGQPAGLV